ncbi:hypothetical protein [Candidatus Thiodictyon syntrophicum]|jgi:hypothetical protein|uniref:Uncharacterized protein n=1 Tax=Candidatus Thiodictyon syntrophicum TaxID=1166950 RepID=A0A2K8U3Q5_9GAMM|nr:hypothetical protein [Candidatus Thiodictyon syntrophicum]AUB80208.1 hypothetical protein THSYN_04020 [Candidatus Thiodictyon syntrophicum]
MAQEAALGFERDPRHPLAMPTVLRVYAALTDPQAQAAFMARLKAVVPHDVDLALVEARSLAAADDQARALQRLADLHRSSPQHQGAYHALVQGQLGQGDLVAATRTV